MSDVPGRRGYPRRIGHITRTGSFRLRLYEDDSPLESLPHSSPMIEALNRGPQPDVINILWQRRGWPTAAVLRALLLPANGQKSIASPSSRMFSPASPLIPLYGLLNSYHPTGHGVPA